MFCIGYYYFNDKMRKKKKEMKKKEKKKKKRKDLDQLPRYVHPGVPFILYIYVGYVPFIILSF